MKPPAHLARVAIIGAGRGGTALIQIFRGDPLVKIVGVADINPAAKGMQLARRLRIPTTTDYRKLLRSRRVVLVIDVTGNREVERALLLLKRSGLTVIGGLSARFMWQLIEARIKANEEIERHLREYASLYRLYVKEVETAITEERTRIACDIHDGLVQTLVGLNYKLDVCDDLISQDPAQARDRFKEARMLLKGAIEEARAVIFNLRPLSFEAMELIPAIRAFLRTYEGQYGIETEFRPSGNERRLSRTIKLFLFRIVQEALSNVQKHARARRVLVELAIGPRSLEASVTDDGIGFRSEEYTAEARATSFGLKGILERARLLGGSARIESRPGEGTRVTVRLPIPAAERKVS